MFPQNGCVLLGGSEPQLNAWFFGPTRVHYPNSISIGSSVSAGLTVVSNRWTDTLTHHATSVARGHIFGAWVGGCMLCSLIIAAVVQTLLNHGC